MNRKYLLLPVILVLLSTICPVAKGVRYDVNTERERLISALKEATTSSDSLQILYDLFDVETRVHKRAVGLEIYELAVRTKRYSEALDIIRNIAGFVTDEDGLTRLLPKVEALPKSRERAETILFIKMKKISGKSRRMTYTQQHDYIKSFVDTLRKVPNLKPTFDERILDLYTVASMLRNDDHVSMMIEYVDSLIKHAGSKEFTVNAIPNLIYSEAANIYSDARMPKNAIVADRQLMKIINALDVNYKEAGRRFRNYDINRYICYRRMLRNYEGLEPGDADRIYERIMELAAVNEDVAKDLHKNNIPHTYYMMAKGKYDDAIPLIKEHLKEDNPLPVQRQLIDMLAKAATETGDTVSLLSALEQKNHFLSDMSLNNADRKYKELQTAYDLSHLRNAHDSLKLRVAQEEAQRMKNSMVIMGVIWVLIVILLAVTLFFWSRYRKNAQNLHNFAHYIRIQRDNLKRSLYYDSARETDDDNYEGLHTINHQTPVFTPAESVIEGIVSDVMYVSAMGRDERVHHISPVHLPDIMNDVRKFADTEVKENYEDVNIVIEKTPEDITMITDRDCLEYILKHILLFGAEHCGANGTVTLRTFVDLNTNEISFRISHSGRLIEQGREETLFRNIVDFRNLAQKKDAVVFMCRMNAFLLNCHLSYNPHRDREAELFFNVPIKLNE